MDAIPTAAARAPVSTWYHRHRVESYTYNSHGALESVATESLSVKPPLWRLFAVPAKHACVLAEVAGLVQE
jgi:hypothetical protein